MRLKYCLDRLLGAGAAVTAAPLLGLIAALIKLDDGGPVFFTQERPGLGGRPFKIWKFRTMLVDADRYLGADGRATKPRVTRVGRLLRWSSLDELPQLFNIVNGTMSFVGPRPTLMEYLPRYTDEQMRRFEMKPGVTGLAQVNGRHSLKLSQRIAYDVEYVDRYSLLLDLRILIRTIRVVLLREGAVIDRNPDNVDLGATG